MEELKNNKKRYRVLEILHSGRKNTRNKPVDNPKYDGIIGSIVELAGINSIEGIRQFNLVSFEFVKTSSDYDWWNTSAVISVFLDFHNRYHIETINTIYILEEVNSND